MTFLLYHSSIHWLCIPRDINNGVYRAGFATKQEAYDTAVKEVFAALDRVEEILSQRRYLTGSQITEADIRLYTTLARFDCVYVGHFKVRVTYFAAVYMCIPGTMFWVIIAILLKLPISNSHSKSSIFNQLMENLAHPSKLIFC